jgi:hypothetical protein
MARLSLSCVSEERVRGLVLGVPRLARRRWLSHVFLKESRTGIGAGSTVGGARRGREEEHDSLGMIARQFKLRNRRSGRGRKKGSGWREGEEQWRVSQGARQKAGEVSMESLSAASPLGAA